MRFRYTDRCSYDACVLNSFDAKSHLAEVRLNLRIQSKGPLSHFCVGDVVKMINLEYLGQPVWSARGNK